MKKLDVLRVWGRVLRGHTPFLSIEITKECPLRCPGCYAYSPDHLGPVTTLRQLSDYRGQDLVTAMAGSGAPRPPGSRLDHRRRAAGPVSRTLRALAAARPHGRGSAIGHQRGAPDSGGVELDPVPAPGGLDRRPGPRARPAARPGDLRSHPEAHRRPAHCGALHGYPADAGAARLSRRLLPVLVASARSPQNLVQHLHSAGGR